MPTVSALQTDRLLFALRTSAAALLACLIAMAVPLPQASTSILTVFIVSQPLAGMVLSKALYRIIGTCVGAVVAIAMTETFTDQPEVFAVVASAWIALCVYVSIYLRDAPSAYGALLSGYTVALIAFPAVDAPETVFLSGMNRVAEICLGIACATLLSQIFFPRSAGKALKGAVDTALAQAANWAELTLRGRQGDAGAIAAERRALVASIGKLDGLRIQANFDTPNVRRSNHRIRSLHARLVTFLALSVSLHDRLEDLREQRPARAAALGPLLERVARLMQPGAEAGDRPAALADIGAALPTRDEMRDDPERVMERATLLRIIDLVAMRGDLDRMAAGLPSEIDAGGEAPATLERHRDHRLAAASAFAAFVALLAVFAFWIGTGWPTGATAVIQLAVMVSLFAQQDDPATAAATFFFMTIAGAAMAAVYLFAVLPQLHSFESLALALLPVLLVVSYALSIPAYILRALAFGLGMISSIGLAPSFVPSFATFANSTAATLFGVGLAAVLLRVLRPTGVSWPIARLRDALYLTLADAMEGGGRVTRAAFESRMLDLVNGLMSRLDLRDPPQLALERGALVGFRVGLNALVLRGRMDTMPASVRAPLTEALERLAGHFRRMARRKPSEVPLRRLDAAIAAALAEADDGSDLLDTAATIAALRSSLARRPEMFGVIQPGEAA